MSSIKLRKILYSPGYGAGWTSWHSDEVAKITIDYKPIVDALENSEALLLAGKKTPYASVEDAQKHPEKYYHPSVVQLLKDCKDLYNRDYICLDGLRDLRVYPTMGRVKIEEHAGSESVIQEGYGDAEWL